MSETSATDSPARRLAIGRLTGPGILDHRALQRTRDRFALPTRLHALDPLQRRIAPATPSTERLPLVRLDRSIDREAVTSFEMSGGASASAAGDHAVAAPGVAHTAPAPFVDGLVARQAPTISRIGAFIARRIASTAGVIASNNATSRALGNANQPAVAPGPQLSSVIGDVSKGTLQRTQDRAVGDSTSGARATAMRAASTGHTATVHPSPSTQDGVPTPMLSTDSVMARAANPMVWRKTDSAQAGGPSDATPPLLSAASPTRPTTDGAPQVIARKSLSSSGGQSAAPPVVHYTGAPPRVSTDNRSSAVPQVLWRKSNASTPITAATALVRTTPSPSISPPAQLVLRKAVVSTTESQSPLQPPSITPSPTQIVARMADDGHRATLATTHTSYTSSHDWNIDWITEQVGRRLARRLEIERERRGARAWR